MRQSTREFVRSTSGGVSVVFAVGLAGLLICAGAAIDYGRWQMDQTGLQAVADSASLAAVHQLKTASWTDASVAAMVADFVEPNGAGLEQVKVDSVTVDKSVNQLHVILSMPGQRSFTSLFMKEDPTIRVSTTVKLGGDRGTPVCVHALDPGMSKALEGSGGTIWTANGCSVQVNSNNSSAVVLSGNSKVTSEENCIVGGVSQGLANVSPAPTPGCQPKPDPFASLPKPDTSGSCDYTKFSNDKSMTLSPGLYCGGLTLKNSTFTFEPGLYVIKDGAFVTSGGATLIGDGVSFFLTGTNAGVTWSGGGSYQLKAMRTGLLAGFVIYIDPNATPLSKSVVSGTGNTTYEGALYFPNQKLELSGGSSATTPSPFTAFIAKNFLFSGGSTLNINVDADKTTVPIPAGLYSGSGTPRLIN